MKRKLRWIFAAVVPCLMMAASPAGAQGLGVKPEAEAARGVPGIPVGPGLWRLSPTAWTPTSAARRIWRRCAG